MLHVSLKDIVNSVEGAAVEEGNSETKGSWLPHPLNDADDRYQAKQGILQIISSFRFSNILKLV